VALNSIGTLVHPAEHRVRQTFREREMAIEHSINFVRMTIIGVGVLLDLFTAISQGLAGGSYEIFAVGIVIVAAAYVAVVHLFTRGGAYHGWVKYLTITADYLLILAYFREMLSPQFAGRVDLDSVIAVSVMVLFVIIMLNALRLSSAAVIYATIVGAAITLYITAGFSHQPMARIWYSPLVVAAGGVVYWTSRNVRTIVRALWRREKLARFVPRELVDIVENSDLELTLGGKATTATVLFADIRNFTRFSEKRDPEAVVAILNRYFSAMAAIIDAYGGMIDKYIGDAVMAVFGVPIAREGDASRAVSAAGAMLRKLDELNAEWGAEGQPPLAIGIALHTGVVIAGNIGSPDRMDYTVIGDTVNLASRLEEMNKRYHTALVMSRETCEAAGHSGVANFIAETEIRGREQPVQLYTLAGVAEQGTVAEH